MIENLIFYMHMFPKVNVEYITCSYMLCRVRSVAPSCHQIHCWYIVIIPLVSIAIFKKMLEASLHTDDG